jgi:hypothetical protein
LKLGLLFGFFQKVALSFFFRTCKGHAVDGGGSTRWRVPFAICEVLQTPNPNAIKFVLDQPVSEQPLSFLNPAAAVDYPLARNLFDIAGVTGVLLLGDFVTINKSPSARWADIKRNVQHVLSSA